MLSASEGAPANGPVALVTGASSGIGEATARLLAARYGAKLVLVARREARLRELAEQIGSSATWVAADLTADGAPARVRDHVAERHGRIDVLVNNAGIALSEDRSVLDTSLEAWQRVQEVNLRGVFLCCKHGIPHLLETGGGSVVNLASFVAVMGAAVSQIAYTASKGGVLALSRELGIEFARRGVRVNAICPGPVQTPLLKELFAKDPAQAHRRLVHVPMGRFAQPREIAYAALFLSSDESSYVNASTFLVDGGISQAYLTPE